MFNIHCYVRQMNFASYCRLMLMCIEPENSGSKNEIFGIKQFVNSKIEKRRVYVKLNIMLKEK